MKAHSNSLKTLALLTSLSLSLALSGCGLIDALIAGLEPTPSSTSSPGAVPSSRSTAAPVISAEGAYTQQALVSGNTSPETKSLTAAAGKGAQVQLSDGTLVQTPAANAPFALTLARQSNTEPLAFAGLQKTGSLRVLQIENLSANAVAFPITIRFPASEAGSINKDTLGVMRVSDEIVNGVMQKNHSTLLPAEVDSQGQVKAVDYFFPQTVQVKTVQAAAGIAIAKATIKYFLVTQQANLNWAAAPQLVRMVPDKTLAEKRKPLDQLTGKDRSVEEKKCVRNVILLLHGHNEAEKDGYLGKPDVAPPWNFSYKRDVWTQLYSRYLETPGLEPKSSCTVFYEYIYPSFRPAFENLGPDLATRLKSELQPLLANPDADPNLLIVAHSMGGLVARTGIQQFDAPLHKAFQRLVTWGTPHRGSILVSLSYVMNAGADYSLLGQADADTSEILSRLVQNYVQIDAPGARDLRWDNNRPLRLDEWFEPGPNQPDNDAIYSLTNGKRIYNTRLKALNESDIYATSADSSLKNKLGQLKYYFAYGRTDKILTDGLIGIGATAARRLIKNPDDIFDDNYKIRENDGAVPVTSAGGEGLTAERERFTDMDHEELYGAAKAPSVFNGESRFEQPAKGAQIADMTFNRLYLSNSSLDDYFKCDPYIKSISPQQGEAGASVQIKGRCFNNADEKLAVYFNHQKAQNISVKNCNEINVNAPDNLTSGDVTVVANGKESNGIRFSLTTQQKQDVCKNFAFPGTWSLVATVNTGTVINSTLQVASNHTFTSNTSSGTWSAQANPEGGWFVEFVFKNGTSYQGSTQEPGCELKGRATSGGGADLGLTWVAHR